MARATEDAATLDYRINDPSITRAPLDQAPPLPSRRTTSRMPMQKIMWTK